MKLNYKTIYNYYNKEIIRLMKLVENANFNTTVTIETAVFCNLIEDNYSNQYNFLSLKQLRILVICAYHHDPDFDRKLNYTLSKKFTK